jgi:hypothetical protein
MVCGADGRDLHRRGHFPPVRELARVNDFNATSIMPSCSRVSPETSSPPPVDPRASTPTRGRHPAGNALADIVRAFGHNGIVSCPSAGGTCLAALFRQAVQSVRRVGDPPAWRGIAEPRQRFEDAC